MPDSAGTWFDSHCHIHEDPDPAKTLAECVDNGIGGLVLVGTTLATSRLALQVADQFKSDFPGVAIAATGGIHPHDAAEALKGEFDDFEKLITTASGSSLRAIGECGLDYFYDYSDRVSQREVFIRQIELANRLSLPLVIHTRDAWEDTFAILADFAATPIIFHCFTGGPDELNRILEFKSVVSFSGIVTFKNSILNAQAAKACPLDRMLIETDSPYLTPVPYRGQRNLPYFVKQVGLFIAGLKDLDPKTVADTTKLNAIRAFSL